jgi:hypothetical protein
LLQILDTFRQAEIAWLIYDLTFDEAQGQYQLTRQKTVYTLFKPALDRITTAEPGSVDNFIGRLQEKLDVKLDSEENPPDAPTLTELL